MIAAELKVKPRVQVASNVMMSIAGLFVPTLREVIEMAYQYDRDYDFRSDRFNQRFDFNPTPYEQGIKAIVEADYRQLLIAAPCRIAALSQSPALQAD